MKVGILGCGQLARMLSIAGYPLGIETISMVAQPDREQKGVTPVSPGSFNDPSQLQQFAKSVDVISYETENIPIHVAKETAQYATAYPSPQALAVAQDRLNEKDLCQRLSIDTVTFCAVSSSFELHKAIAETGLPALLKTRRFGYDGKGQCLIRSEADVKPAWQGLNQTDLILEAFCDFNYEVSIIAVRNTHGQTYFYPISKNIHQHGILYLSEAPFENATIQNQAEACATKILNALNYVGVLAIEFFVKDERLLVNEMAPRVHNSGHWTIEGAHTSQFENHLRAILGLPLGNCAARSQTAMINCIGAMPSRQQILAFKNTHYHDYQKQARKNRKLGHVTLVTDDQDAYSQQLQQLIQLIQIK